MFQTEILLFLSMVSLVLTKFGTQMKKTNIRHCSSPSGSVDGRIVVEEDGGEISDFTTLTWQVALDTTLCYR